MDIEIKQGATTRLIFPAVDADGIPCDLTTLDDVCFLLTGRQRRIEKHDGDEGFEIGDYDGYTNNALYITLSPAETVTLSYGKIYNYWAWANGSDGTDLIAHGDATVIKTERCGDNA